MKIQIIRVNGATEEHEGTMRDIDALIGADMFDFVNLRDGRVMVVDDIGIRKGLAVNERATALYHSVCVPGTTHCIVGDVAIIEDK